MTAQHSEHPWAASDATIPAPDAHCEQDGCGRALYEGVDDWEEQVAPDGDGLTTMIICADCIEASIAEGLRQLAEDPLWHKVCRYLTSPTS